MTESPLLIIESHLDDTSDFVERKTAKAVVYNEQGEVLVFPHSLIGGGLEGDETYEDALHREALEEAGIKIEIEKYIGEVIGYHDPLKRKYIIHGYLCRFVDKIADAIHELDHPPIWENPLDAIARVSKNLEIITEKGPVGGDIEMFESRIGNRRTMLAFLKEIFEKQN